MLALSFSANTSFAKEVLFGCSKEYTNTPSGTHCPEQPGYCTITVTVYDDYTGTIDVGEMVIPFNDPDLSQHKTQMMLDDVANIIETDGIVYDDYQPLP